MLNIDALFSKSWLISGKFDGERIIKSPIRHALHISAIIISTFECLKAFFLVLKPSFKFYLIQMYMTDGYLVQTLFNIGAIFIHLSMTINHVAFYDFNHHPERISFLKYLFYRSPKEIEDNYQMDEIYVKKFFKYKKYFWHLANFVSWLFVILLESLILRCTVTAIYKVSLIVFFTMSIPFSITLLAAFYYSSYATMATYITFIANCNFIALRIEDLTNKMENILKNFTNSNDKKQNKKIYKIMFQMNTILKFYRATQYLADRSISAFYLAILLIFLFYPYMMIFENNGPIFQVILIVGYLNTLIATCLTIVLSNNSVHRWIREYESVVHTALTYPLGSTIKLKLQSIYTINQPNNLLHFKCFGLFSYTKEFLLDWILNSITMVFLLYGTKNSSSN